MGVSDNSEGGGIRADLQAGYVQELLARLNDSSPIQSPTINGTLDSNPATFPQGGKRLFVVSARVEYQGRWTDQAIGLQPRQRDDRDSSSHARRSREFLPNDLSAFRSYHLLDATHNRGG